MTNRENSSLLVVVAHPDDECLGAGGTIAAHTNQGVPVDVLCLTGTVERNKELETACNRLGVRHLYSSLRDDFAIDLSLTGEVSNAILKTRPSVVITHSIHDYNRNHATCARIVDESVEWASHVTIVDNAHKVDRIYQMEINSLHTQPSIMMNITEVYDTAMLALKEHKSQIEKADGYYLKLYNARTRLRGIQAACERAEAFILIPTKHVGPFYQVNNVELLV